MVAEVDNTSLCGPDTCIDVRSPCHDVLARINHIAVGPKRSQQKLPTTGTVSNLWISHCSVADKAHLDTISLIITLIYVADVIIRLYGLGWRSFLTNGWNIFDVIVASGSFITTILARFYPNSYDVQLLQKLFLVSMTFKLVQRMAALNHLFMSGV